MKKLLAFVVLFGVALLVLRYFEGDSDVDSNGEVEQPPENGGEDDTGGPSSAGGADAGAGDTGAGDTGEGNGGTDEQVRPLAGLSINGPFEARLFDGREGEDVRSLVLFVKSTDSRTDAIGLGGPEGETTLRDVLLSASADLFEVGVPDTPQSRIQARELSFPREAPDGEDEPMMGIEPSWIRLAELTDVDVSLLTSAPFVPLTFRAPSATLDARDNEARTLFAPGAIEVDSVELQSKGTDLTMSLDEGSFSFAREAQVDFLLGTGERVTLESSGQLVVVQRPDLDPTTGDVVQIEARDGAFLRFEGEEESVLTARTIRARGRESEGVAGDFRLTRFEAEGDVVWTSGDAEARGERAVLDFKENGELRSWRLVSNPSLRFQIEEMQGLEPAAEPASGFVRITGAGPLTGRSGDVRSFLMAGPAAIDVIGPGDEALPHTTLRAAGSVSGNVDEAGERSELSAAGGVLLEAPEGELEAQALTARLSRTDEDVDVLEITTVGGAKLTSTTQDGRVLTLVSGGRLQATRTGEAWKVGEAGDVTLAVQPEDLEQYPEKIDEVFRAQAGRVTYFDPLRGDLRADGGVAVQGVKGIGRGVAIVVTEGDRIELEGTPESPATFEGIEGKAQALRIVRQGDRTEARGEVVTRFVRVGGPRFPTQDYEIRCDELDAEQNRTVAEDGSEVRAFDLEARGSVDGRVGFGDESSSIRCDRLVGARRERWLMNAEQTLVPLDARTILNATGSIEGSLALRGSQVELTCSALDLTRAESLTPLEDGQDPDDARFTLTALASGGVEFDLLTVRAAEPVRLEGRGESLRIDETLTGEILPTPGELVHLEGSLPGQETPYVLDASSILFTGGERIEALEPIITVGEESEQRASISRFRARAARLEATNDFLRLEDSVRLETTTAAGAPWSLTANEIEIEGGVGTAGAGPQLERLRADGGVEIALGMRGRSLEGKPVALASARRITGSSIAGTIRLEGYSEDRPARVVTPAMTTEALWIEVDPEIQLIRRSGPGRMVPVRETVPGVPDWELSYSAAYSYEDRENDSFVFAIDQPYFDSRYMDGLLRSTVALFWFDKIGWQDLPERVEQARRPDEDLRRGSAAAGPPSQGVPIARLLDILRGRNLEGVLKEAYFEGPIEILRGDLLVAHAEAIYVDCVDAKAWLKRAQLNIYGEDVGEDFEKLVVRAEWVRQSDDGVLNANGAAVTTSPFAEPSLVVETGDLRIVPSPDGEDKTYQVYLRENRIRFGEGGFSLPLPPIAFGTDEDYKPLWPTARFANSARFGTLLTLGFRRPLPKGIGDTLNDALGGKEEDPYDASFSADASYLSGRGALFDLGVDIEAANNYELETLFGIVPDSGDDEGYIRVPESGRRSPRLWFRAHSRFEVDPAEWLDIEASYQSDASVQSEFWENEFERYERDESYLQWRKAKGETYYQATAKARLDQFRSTVEELPTLGAHFGRRPVLNLGPTSVIWDGDVDASYLRRRAGKSGVQSPFAETPLLDDFNEFADGLGDREVLRLDARQRFEVPLVLGSTGVRATPFVDGRFTAWDEGANPEASPTRVLATAGLRLATQLWRLNSNGSMHQLVPFVEYANAIVEEAVGSPVTFDGVEAPIGGDRLDLGLRGRLNVAAGQSLFDFELRARHLRNVPAGVEPGWQPLSVFTRVNAEAFGAPIELWHDARYALDDGSTRYALTAVGVRASEELAFEIGHRVGRDVLDQRGFEAAVISAIYRWTEKWEFEGRQVYSLLRDSGLDAGIILRRYGTDLVFELEFDVREGEGSSVGISFRPRFGYRPSEIGTISF